MHLIGIPYSHNKGVSGVDEIISENQVLNSAK